MVSDRLAIVNKGSVVACGSPEEIKGLVKEKFRVVINGDFKQLSNFSETARMGDRNIVYLKTQDEAIDLLRTCLKMNLRAETSPVTLEDVFVKLVGGLNNHESK